VTHYKQILTVTYNLTSNYFNIDRGYYGRNLDRLYIRFRQIIIDYMHY